MVIPKLTLAQKRVVLDLIDRGYAITPFRIRDVYPSVYPKATADRRVLMTLREKGWLFWTDGEGWRLRPTAVIAATDIES
jgi:hypothetical protein